VCARNIRPHSGARFNAPKAGEGSVPVLPPTPAGLGYAIHSGRPSTARSRSTAHAPAKSQAGHERAFAVVGFAVSQTTGEKLTMPAMKLLLASIVLLSGAQVNAADRFSMSFFSLVPPAGWWTESDKQHRLVSGAGKGEHPPFLIVESCSPGGGVECPSKCDVATVAQTRSVADLHLAVKEVKRDDDYAEFAASQEVAFEGGKASSSFRLLCGPAGFIYMALMEIDPLHDSAAELDAVVASIKWSK